VQPSTVVREPWIGRCLLLGLVIALLALSAPCFGQTDAIAVSVSRTVDLSPEELYISLAVATDQDVTLEQVVQATQSLGLAAKDLTGVNIQQFGPSPSQSRLNYVFNISVPYAKFKETTDKVTALRRTLAANTPSMEIQMYGMTIMPGEKAREEARQKLLSALFEDAKVRAEQLAKAAGVNLGGIVGATEYWGANVGIAYASSGPYGPSTLKTALSLNVRYAVK
jgi:hypothetical protein